MNLSLLQSALPSFAEVIFWLTLSYLVTSLLEYLFHKYFMHRKRFSKWVYKTSPYILDVFEAHAVRHHSKWYRKFNHEPNPEGREDNLDILFIDTLAILLVTSPIWGLMMWINTWGGIIFLAVAFTHRYLWNNIHRQMHIPEDVFYRKWKIFQYLARHHFLHHQRNDKNFNVVFPGSDVVFGTKATARIKDIREMLRLGHLVPRSKRAQDILHQQGLPELGANR